MIECSIKSPADYKIQTWKNGLGKTTELAVDTLSPFRWRLSIAKLTDSGPFSSYPGYDRVLVLLNGGPLFLVHSTGKSRHLNALTPYKFKGEWNTVTELSSPGEDFNLLLLSEKAKGSVYPTFVAKGEEMQFPIAGNEHFVYCIEGSVKLYERNLSKEFEIGAGQLFRFSRTDTKEYLNLKAVGTTRSVLLWVVVHVNAE